MTIQRRIFAMAIAVITATVVLEKAKAAVENGSFEKGTGSAPTGWQPVTESGTPTFAWENSGHAGKRCVSIETLSETDIGYWKQTVKVVPNHAYTARVWFHTDKSASALAPGFQLRMDDNGGSLLGDWYLDPKETWTQFSHTFTSGSSTSLDVRLYLFRRVQQKVWFDDVDITIGLLPNASFEHVADKSEQSAGWTMQGGVALDNAVAYDGKQSLKFESHAQATSTKVPVEANVKYHFAAYYQAEHGLTPVARIKFFDVDEFEIPDATVTFNGKTALDWTELAGEALAPAEAVTARIELSALGAAGHLWMDQIYLAP